jgi:hypothetical protein
MFLRFDQSMLPKRCQNLIDRCPRLGVDDRPSGR